MGSTDTVLAGIGQELDWQQELYEDLHRHPELGLEEHRTAGIVEDRLEEFGFDVQRIGGTGVVGVLSNGDGATVLARADIDALPVTEDTGLEYASTVDGVMHACAHDMHATALLGAAKLLAASQDAWSGTYIALFQPSEENAAGAEAMVADGLVDKLPRPDVAFGQHVMPAEAGRVGTTAGPILSAGDSLKITVHGRGAHGSMPHNSVDPVVLAASIVLKLQTVVSRETMPGQFAVVTVGASNAGATANVIPDRAELRLNIRTYDPALRKRVMRSIERIVRGECDASGSPREPDFEYYDQFPLTSNDANVNQRVTDAFTAHFDDDQVYTTDPATASEDFSTIPDAFGIPYAYWTVGCVPAETYRRAVENDTVSSDIPANHSPFFAPAIDPTLETATRTQVVAALAYLGAEGVDGTEG
ncbi:amidohydrolase [Brevibacterium yomogidense]|uniref:N-acetyl-L,L-diaminopimelate deacetylase n=1 Tax=Brevibacterium yomogidense TaxID=946573 RepID=A0A1X6WV56_9MICO|nr:amidohydrolase [Brevibacterium yomogidense]SLM89133.1 N-acetyl-L,L-diaminopimelate deacetylase [Brevibacterium yomogidense]